MSGLWEWAVAAYGRPGAAEACLALQDGRGQNVPLVLWTVWRARTGAPPDDGALAAAAEIARRWEQAVMGPLRAVRRELRSPLPGPPEEEREAFRARVQALELEAERLVMSALEDVGGGSSAAHDEAELLERVSHAYGRPAAAECFADVLARL